MANPSFSFIFPKKAATAMPPSIHPAKNRGRAGRKKHEWIEFISRQDFDFFAAAQKTLFGQLRPLQGQASCTIIPLQ
jgi:hypothetical protein